jgi:hypothetical protein
MIKAFKSAMPEGPGKNEIVLNVSGDVGQIVRFLGFEIQRERKRSGNNFISGDVWY